ncbi:MAG: type II toxin-antitoxin system PemK/MazF family toxin [Acidobacteria bacterium]|nr:type II toxin-antitoxin system PemK/MazF family toxin [Acidobacteriota bacterium]
MTCEAWDVVTVPFPFTDRATQKRRPALILSRRSFNRHGHSLLAMITSSRPSWPGDSPLAQLASCGLSAPCIVRLKLFTLDNRLIVKRIGRLSGEDKNRVASALKATLPF